MLRLVFSTRFGSSKGLITPEKFREFCAPTVALLRFPKRAYYCDETFEGKAEVYNYSPSILKSAKAKWWITDASGRVSEIRQTEDTKNRKLWCLSTWNVSVYVEFGDCSAEINHTSVRW